MRGLTFDMSGGPKGAKRPLERPLDGGVRRHAQRSASTRFLTSAQNTCDSKKSVPRTPSTLGARNSRSGNTVLPRSFPPRTNLENDCKAGLDADIPKADGRR